MARPRGSPWALGASDREEHPERLFIGLFWSLVGTLLLGGIAALALFLFAG